MVNRPPGSPSPLSAFLVGCNNGGATLSTICPLVFDEDHNPQSDMVRMCRIQWRPWVLRINLAIYFAG